jgi:hypothetical protein
MNPQTPGGHHPQGPARGQGGQRHLRVQSPAEQRDRWTTCGQTVAATTETPCSRWRTAAEVVTRVVTRRSHGCPTQAIVAAFGVEERPVAAWLTRAGPHGERGHQHVVQQGGVDVPHVHADAWWVTRVGRRGWLALALAVPSRRWLGGVSSPPRDVGWLTRLRQRVRACARTLALWGCVDGWASDVAAGLRGWRYPVHPGRPGRPRWVREQAWLLGQRVQRDGHRRVVSGERRVVRGTAAASAAVVAAAGGGTGINTADRERRNATCRAALAPLVRRGRAIAPTETLVTAGRWRVGCADHGCWRQESWRVAAPSGAPWQWQARTPALAAGLTHHRGTMPERLGSHVPLPAWVAPTRRGRPPTRDQQPAMALAV